MIGRLALAVGGAALALGVIGCNTASPTIAGDCSQSGAAGVVSATDANVFTPNPVTIAAGQSVCWANTSASNHTVTSDVGAELSGTLGSGGTYTHLFATAGVYSYHCTVHEGMVGSVTVQ